MIDKKEVSHFVKTHITKNARFIKFNDNCSTLLVHDGIIKLFYDDMYFHSYMNNYYLFNSKIQCPKILKISDDLKFPYLIIEKLENSYFQKIIKYIDFIKKSAKELKKLHSLQSNLNLRDTYVRELNAHKLDLDVNTYNQFLTLIQSMPLLKKQQSAFTHCDFVSKNILYLSGHSYIIDYESAQFFDYYLDLYSAYYDICHRIPMLFDFFISEYDPMLKINKNRFRLAAFFYHLLREKSSQKYFMLRKYQIELFKK